MRLRRTTLPGLLLIALIACAPEDRLDEHPRRVRIEGADALSAAVEKHAGPVIVDYWAPR